MEKKLSTGISAKGQLGKRVGGIRGERTGQREKDRQADRQAGAGFLGGAHILEDGTDRAWVTWRRWQGC